MSVTDKKDQALSLLPSGFADLLPPLAEQEAGAIAVLMAEFARFGYRRIKPPLAEFEDSLLAPGPGAALARETFRLMDPVSHRMLGLRSDITPQISRIAASVMAGEPRPLRLAYANDVLRTSGNQNRTARQFCQVGCEIIGAPDAQEQAALDAESCVVSLIALKSLGLETLTIDLTIPRLTDTLFDLFAVPAHERTSVSDGLRHRDKDCLQALSDAGLRTIFSALLDIPGSAAQALPRLEALELPPQAAALRAHLIAACRAVQQAVQELGLSGIQITLDPLEVRGFEYHTGIGFTLFAPGISGELGRGGRYEVRFGADGASESASGFTLYMDTLRAALPVAQPARTTFVGTHESWATIRKLQDEGWIVVRGNPEKTNPKN